MPELAADLGKAPSTPHDAAAAGRPAVLGVFFAVAVLMVLLPLGTFFGARWALDDDLVAAVIAAAVAQCIALGYAVFAYFDVPSEAPGRQAAVADASSAGPGEALVQPDTQSLRDGGARDKLKSI